MKSLRFTYITLLGCAALALAGNEPTSEGLIARLNKLETFTRVTKEPVPLDVPFVDMCEPTVRRQRTNHIEVYGKWNAVVHVLVSAEGVASFRADLHPYPEGTIILKQKFAHADAGKPDFYTGMLKREKGYNPKVGDWEFFTLSGDAKTITARGRMNDCMDCHGQHPNSDFVMKELYSWALRGEKRPNELRIPIESPTRFPAK